MSLYLFLLSGAGGSPGGGECHTWANRSLPPPTAPWLVVWRVGKRDRKRRDRDRKFWLLGEYDMVWVSELGWKEPALGWG